MIAFVAWHLSGITHARDRLVADAIARSMALETTKAIPDRCELSAQTRELVDPEEMRGAE